MEKNPTAHLHNLRKKHNADLIRRMRDGDPLKSFDSKASWFPPRPVIEKDEAAVARLYGTTSRSPRVTRFAESSTARSDRAAVVALRPAQDLGSISGDESHSEAS